MKTYRWLKQFALLLILGATVSFNVQANPYDTDEEWTSYRDADNKMDIPALLVAPKKRGNYPVALYIHGRWGLSDEVIAYLHDLAERGVVILAPDYYYARAIPSLPMFNDLDVENDISAGIDHLLKIADDKTKLDADKVALIAQDHGGYFATRIASSRPDVIAAYISWYAVAQNPNSPKAKQIYGYMEEVDKVLAPSLFMIGGEDRQMRRIHVERVAKRMQFLKRDANYIEYPGAERCFDWRTKDASLPNSLARTDSFNQAVRFMKDHVGGDKLLILGNKGWETI